MKKYIVLLSFLLGAGSVHAQGRIGLQVAPTVSFCRAYTEPNNKGFVSKGFGVRGKVGVIYDYSFQKNYNLSTGLFYASHRFTLEKDGQREVHELHYFQIPALFKPYTSEISLDFRAYAMLGLIGQFKLTTRNTHLEQIEQPFIDSFRRWGLAGLLGAGVEYDTGFSTSIFGGISFHLGLANLINSRKVSNLIGYSNLISVDLGVRF